MGTLTLNDGTVVGDYKSPYFIAEVNSSHNGNIEVAQEMIDKAVAAGCNCVKFQSWSAASLYSKTYYQKNPIAKRFVDKFSLPPQQLKELSDYCREKHIAFSSTPYSEEEVDFLVGECRVPFIKIASMEINNPDFLQYIGNTGLPLILSTGMSEMTEIRRAVDILEAAGNHQLVLLHCISIYPAELKTINLNNILGLREIFPDYPIGFSDHTLGDAAAIAATALGAAVIEKHLTLDRKKIGMDNQMAMEPPEWMAMTARCRAVNQALGSRDRAVLPEEYEQRRNMRRSIVAARDLERGTILQKEDLSAKRPGTGVPPDKIDLLIGHKLNRDIEADTLILESDII